MSISRGFCRIKPFRYRRSVGYRCFASFANTPEHKELRSTVQKLVQTEINPFIDDWEAKKAFPAHQVFKKFGDAGLLGISKPTEFGGLGLDYSFTIAFAEEIGAANCGGVPMALGVQTDMATPALAKFGSDRLRKTFLTPAIEGTAVACVGVSEPSAGSDVARIKTKAEKVGDDYVINGSKMWITNGAQADWICLLCNTSDESLHSNKSLIIVPMNSKGVTVSRKIDKLGMHCSDTAEIFFEDVRVPQWHRIGDEGVGFMYQMLQFQEERLFASASILRAMEVCIEKTIEYTQQRSVFGHPLIKNQVIRFKLAELQTEVESLRALVYRCGESYIDGEDVTKLVSMAKLKTGRLSREVTDACIQYWGGMGYAHESIVNRLYRDLRLIGIAGGADEVMLGIISKYMFGSK